MSSERTDTTRNGPVAASGGRHRRAELVEQAVRDFQAGRDREASFRFLYRSYYRPLLRFFADQGLAPEDCQDLTQETFFGVYRGLKTYRHQMRFGSWIYRLATNAFRKRLRAAGAVKRSAREVSLDAEPAARSAPDDAPDQLAEVIHDEKRQAMRRAIRELPEQMRECLTLRLRHELSYREIALVMKITVDTVKTHLFQARRRLRDKLADHAWRKLDV